ncbi:hypothetical protein B0I37DRAFT_83958 [Chaetomium sp. MPI-CAGE-AT-0009]|nr:hypothetical protein B0I37DRAFT_83958 [Chaetomium sp. MPI-CAGE-AT-0009]
MHSPGPAIPNTAFLHALAGVLAGPGYDRKGGSGLFFSEDQPLLRQAESTRCATSPYELAEPALELTRPHLIGRGAVQPGARHWIAVPGKWPKINKISGTQPSIVCDPLGKIGAGLCRLCTTGTPRKKRDHLRLSLPQPWSPGLRKPSIAFR